MGPTEAIAVVVPVSENAESTLQCLIGKDIDVKPGQSATVVITAETRKDVLLLPLSVIAGRQGKGMVTVIMTENKFKQKLCWVQLMVHM